MAPSLFLFFAPVGHTSLVLRFRSLAGESSCLLHSALVQVIRELRGVSGSALFMNLGSSAAEESEYPAHAKPGLLKIPVHPRRLCIPNLHPTSWSLPPLAKTGLVYFSTAHSGPDDTAESRALFLLVQCLCDGTGRGPREKAAAYVGISPWHRPQGEAAGVKRKT